MLFVLSIIAIVVNQLAVRIVMSKRLCENVIIMANERRIVRETSLFNQQVVYKVYLDDILLLSIVVDLDSMQFSTPQFDCDLEVLSKESSILVKLCSLFKDELNEMGVA